MNKFISVASLMMTVFTMALAQGKYNVKGSIIDSETGQGVEGANVQMLSLPDSVFVTGAAADQNGMFTLKNVEKKAYALKITFVGYATKMIDANLKDKKGKNIDLGYITLNSDAKLLKDAEVTAAAAKVQVSGDSLVYNASAYRVPEGSTLEALVKLLPGAKVDENGNITINGKSVNKILVDGKEFFLNDKEVAMKNIPTDMIEKIKSYERKSDLARVTGIDDGEEEMVLDLTVKKGMNNGWFGNVNLGGGTNHFYNMRGLVNRFNDNMQVSILGNARNTPNRWWNNGRNSNKEVGGNFATTAKKLETGGSVRYRYNGSDNANQSSSENFAAQKGAFNESISQSYSSNSSVNANARVEWKPDTMTNIIFRPNFTYSRNRGMSSSRSGSYDKDPNDITPNVLDYNDKIAEYKEGMEVDDVLKKLLEIVVNTNTNRGQTYSSNINGNGNLQVNRRFNNAGRNLTVRVNGGFGEGKNKQLSAANITYNSLGTDKKNNRYYNTPSRNFNILGQVTYSEPVGEKTYLQLSYQYQYSYSKNDRAAFFYESDAYQDLARSLQANRYDIDAVLRFMEQAGYEMAKNDSLSQFSEYRNYNQTISLQFRKVRDNYNFNVGLDAYPQRTTLNYRYMGKEYPEVTRNVFNISPRAQIRWIFDEHTNLRIRYNGRTSQPSMTNLLDIRDDSNPLNITRGNPNLKPSFSNNLSADFNTYNVEAQRGVWFYGSFSNTSNSISNKTTYNKITGVRTTMPMNINGNWNTNANIGFNTGIGKKKLFTAGANIGGNYSHNVGFYNNSASEDDDNEDIKSITNNLSLNGGIDGTFRTDRLSIMVRGDINWNHINNNINSSTPDTYEFSYGFDGEWTMPWGTELATDIFMNSRRGYAQQEMNTNELIWNASVSHSMLKGKALTIKAEVFDILNQQTNISRTVNAFMRSDSRTNAVYQYAMLSVIYRFSIFAGKNTMGTEQERSEGNRWGRW